MIECKKKRKKTKEGTKSGEILRKEGRKEKSRKGCAIEIKEKQTNEKQRRKLR